MNKRVHGWVRGRVQGVCFRYYTRQTAKAMGILGWVRNISDGRVEFVAEGDNLAVDAFIEWCKNGPDTSHVSDLEVEIEPLTGEFSAFTITG